MTKQRAKKTFATREQARKAGYVPTERLEGLLGRAADWLKRMILKRPIKGDLTVLGLRAALLVICLPAIACLLLSFSVHV